MSETKVDAGGLLSIRTRMEEHERRIDEHETRLELAEGGLAAQGARIAQFDKAWLKGEKHQQALMKKMDEMLKLMRRRDG